ncbi:MAG: DUF6089 family protein [Chitinophagaceae bacterium]
MRTLVLTCLLVLPGIGFAQSRLHLNFFGGISNYEGDLQEKYFTMQQSNLAAGLGLQYDITNHLAVRLGFNYGKVEGNDKEATKEVLRARNLSFQTKIAEVNLLLEYSLFDIQERKATPYVFGGIAVFHYNPYAYDTLGNKIYLKPLSTEGQGLAQYPDRKPYNLTQFALPFGVGVKLRITDRAILAYEIGFRKLFTDYLDDVSKTYVDAFTLAQERGLKAVEMSYRGGELKGGNPDYPADGVVRGGAKYKDWYYFTGFTLSFAIGGNGGGGSRNGLACPRKVM